MEYLPPPQKDGPAAEFDLHEIWSVVYRQRWIIAACGLLGLAAALVLIPAPPERMFVASALIRVEEQRSGLPRLDQRGLVPTGNQVATEIEVLRSRTLARSVVDSLQLQLRVTSPASAARSEVFSQITTSEDISGTSYRFLRQQDSRFRVRARRGAGEVDLGVFAPGELVQLGGIAVILAPGAAEYPLFEVETTSTDRAVDALISGIGAHRANREADIIRVTYQNADPAVARDVVNALATRFIDQRNDALKSETRSTIEFLREQINAISVQLAQSEDKLRNFRETAQVINPGAESDVQVRRLAQLQAERSAVEAERSALERLISEVQAGAVDTGSAGLSPYRRLVAFPSLMRNQAVADVLRSLSNLENERSTLLSRRSASDPDVQLLSSRIGELEQQLRMLVTTYLAGLASQVASIDGTLAQFRHQLTRLPGDEVQFARLSREPRVLSEMHGLLQTRLKEAEIAQAVQDPSVRIVDTAARARPLGTSKKRPLMFVAFVSFGLLFGVVLGFAREYRDESVRTRADVQAALGVPVLGLIPRMQHRQVPRAMGSRFRLLTRSTAASSDEAKLAGHIAPAASRRPGTALSPRSSAADLPDMVTDAYDRLHTNILFTREDRKVASVLFTSALPGDGKTTVATNLALTLAIRGLRVVLIDADLRKGRINSVFKTARGPGLADLLSGTAPLAVTLRSVIVSDGRVLHYIATGNLPSNPAQLLGSSQMRELLDTLKKNFDHVIIDSPPLNIVADAAVLGPIVDGVIVVARAGVTPFEALQYAAEQFSHANAPVLGTVLNDIDFERDASYDAAYRSYVYGRAYYTAADGTQG